MYRVAARARGAIHYLAVLTLLLIYAALIYVLTLLGEGTRRDNASLCSSAHTSETTCRYMTRCYELVRCLGSKK